MLTNKPMFVTGVDWQTVAFLIMCIVVVVLATALIAVTVLYWRSKKVVATK